MMSFQLAGKYEEALHWRMTGTASNTIHEFTISLHKLIGEDNLKQVFEELLKGQLNH